ncbi:hypothetical protein F5Y01DRAFT_294027 [Xylaria sp. FL0043]|nr:hypothetical protein F5Y01DRAFT_294027 [Xylaria sp. FL0043]
MLVTMKIPHSKIPSSLGPSTSSRYNLPTTTMLLFPNHTRTKMEFTAESCEISSMPTFHVLQARLAGRPSTDKCESEKSLFYFRARFLIPEKRVSTRPSRATLPSPATLRSSRSSPCLPCAH